MRSIKKKFIVDEDNRKIAVQLDFKTFEQIDRLLEDYVLGELIKGNSSKERMEVKEAKAYYTRLKKTRS